MYIIDNPEFNKVNRIIDKTSLFSGSRKCFKIIYIPTCTTLYNLVIIFKDKVL